MVPCYKQSMPTIHDTIPKTVEGYSYTLFVYDKDDVAQLTMRNAIYLFLEAPRWQNGRQVYNILYVGQTTERVCDRMSGHHKWDEAVRRGFRYLAVMQVNAYSLDRLEREFIAAYHPPLNEKL